MCSEAVTSQSQQAPPAASCDSHRGSVSVQCSTGQGQGRGCSCGPPLWARLRAHRWTAAAANGVGSHLECFLPHHQHRPPATTATEVEQERPWRELHSGMRTWGKRLSTPAHEHRQAVMHRKRYQQQSAQPGWRWEVSRPAHSRTQAWCAAPVVQSPQRNPKDHSCVYGRAALPLTVPKARGHCSQRVGHGNGSPLQLATPPTP
jgi:hypothetical protein